MNAPRVFLFQIIVLALGPASAFAQSDAGVMDGGAVSDAGVASDAGSTDASAPMTVPPPVAVDSVSDQIGACVSTCIARVSRREVTIDDCVRTAPECAGLTNEGSSIRTAICDVARNLVGQCGPEPAPDPPGQVLAAATEQPRPRPRRFQLICQNGGRVGEGWRAHCECGHDRIGVDESRYVLPPGERRERYARDAATVVRVVWCVPPHAVASAREGVRTDLDEAVAALQSGLHDHDAIEAGRCGVSVERWREMPVEDRARCGSGGTGDGVSERRVREIVREATDGLQSQVDSWGEQQGALSTRLDTHQRETGAAIGRLRERIDHNALCLSGDGLQREVELSDGRTITLDCSRRTASSSPGPGMFGFRLSVLFSAGFRNLHFQNQDSIPPLFLGGEFGLTGSFADRWYLEGAVAIGYAFESAPFQESLHGQYRLGFMHLFDALNFPLGVAFGGVLSERYSGVFDSGTFRSDHTLAGAYVDLLINAPTRGIAFYGFVRVIGGVGLRFYSPNDHVNADGSIQFGIGIARFGDDAPAPAPSEEEDGN
jgi:hypothetical protein